MRLQTSQASHFHGQSDSSSAATRNPILCLAASLADQTTGGRDRDRCYAEICSKVKRFCLSPDWRDSVLLERRESPKQRKFGESDGEALEFFGRFDSAGKHHLRPHTSLGVADDYLGRRELERQALEFAHHADSAERSIHQRGQAGLDPLS